LRDLAAILPSRPAAAIGEEPKIWEVMRVFFPSFFAPKRRKRGKNTKDQGRSYKRGAHSVLKPSPQKLRFVHVASEARRRRRFNPD
jgi:hypothetical protein